MSELLKRVLYVSATSPDFDPGDVDRLLAAARHRNVKEGITGLLIYGGDLFFQVIEGTESAVDGLLARLHQDWRHGGLIVLLTEYDKRRCFADWAMGYRATPSFEQAGEGLFDLSRMSIEEALPPEVSRELLVLMKSLYNTGVRVIRRAPTI